MNVRIASLLIATLTLLAACTSTAPAKPESKIDPSANIPAAKTFGWLPANNNMVSTDVTQRKFDESVRAAINTDLTRKGYTEATAEPDLLVSYEIAAYDKTKSSPFSIGVGMGSWGGNVGGGVGVNTGGGNRTVQESRLTVHVVDRKADKEVFAGTMTGSIAPGANSNEITGVVSQALRDFPARRP